MKGVRRPHLFILIIGLGILLNPLNSSMIALAINRLQGEFSITFSDASWLISIFYLASAVAQPVMGKLSDMFGAKRIFLFGLTLMAFASLIAAFSPNFIFLLVFRAFQAIGSSALFPSGMSLVRSEISKGQGRALAILSIFSYTSAAFGPTIGGLLITTWNWPSIFLINIPLIILTFILAIFILPNKKQINFDLKQIDLVGIFLFTFSMIGFIFFLLSLENNINWLALMTFPLLFIVFYFYEINKKDPFIDIVKIKKNHNVLLIYLQFTFINLVYYSYVFGFPTFLQEVYNYSPSYTGFIMLFLAGSGVIVAPIVGRIIDHFGSKLPTIIGSTLILIGNLLLLSYNVFSPLIWLITIMIIIGMGVGFNNISMQSALYENITSEETGSASGVFQTSRYIGAILSSSLLGLTFGNNVNFESFQTVVIICLFFSFLVFLLAFRLPKNFIN